jgi:formate dehydrogenase maturation protein FdhE
MDLEHRLRTIEENARLAEQTLNPHSKIVKMRSLIENLDKVAEYEKRGIEALGGEAADRREKQSSELDQLIVDTADNELDETLSKVRALRTAEEKIKLLESYLMKLDEYADQAGGAKARSRFSGKVKAAIHRIALNRHLDLAQAAETKSQADAARGHYQEALNYLKTLGGGETGEQERIETKLAELPQMKSPKAVRKPLS